MGFDLECLGKPTKRTNRWIASAPLEVADVTALHFGVEGELLLCHAPELTIAPDIFAKKLDRIHNGMWPQASGNVCILNVSFQPSGARCLGNKRTTSTKIGRASCRERVCPYV